MAALRRADRIVIHNNDEKPIHVMTRDLANAEKAKDQGWNSVGELDFAKLPTLPDLIVGRAQGRQSRPRDHLLPEQYRAWLPVRGGRRRGHPQGQGRRPRPRAADRLVHRGRAPVEHDPCKSRHRRTQLAFLSSTAALALEMIERLLRALAVALVQPFEIFLATDLRRSRSCSWRPRIAMISSASLSCNASVSRFWVFWIRNTIRNVTIVVEVLITSCQVSLNPKNGPLIAQASDHGDGDEKGQRLAGEMRRPAGRLSENSAAAPLPLLDRPIVALASRIGLRERPPAISMPPLPCGYDVSPCPLRSQSLWIHAAASMPRRIERFHAPSARPAKWN